MIAFDQNQPITCFDSRITGRGKPGWGKESTRPPWWPGEVPWANVRMDARSEDDKQRVSVELFVCHLTRFLTLSVLFPRQVSWTHALRQIVINCYKYHGREDLLPAFSEDEETSRPSKVIKAEMEMEQEQPNADIQTASQQQQQQQQQSSQQQQQQQTQQQLVQPPPLTAIGSNTAASTTNSTAQYTPTVVQTISNPDGTVSIIQVRQHLLHGFGLVFLFLRECLLCSRLLIFIRLRSLS